jgi:hypothetical protein
VLYRPNERTLRPPMGTVDASLYDQGESDKTSGGAETCLVRRPDFFLAGVVGSVAMVAGTSSASAAVTTFSVNDRASVVLDGAGVVVTGFVQCDSGDTVDVSAVIFQSKGQLLAEGSGDSGDFTCTGGLQAWTVVVQAFIGSFKNGQASSIAEAFDSTDGTASDTVNQTLHLGK